MDHVAPEDPAKLPQLDLIGVLKNLFCEKISITRRRIEILNFRYDNSMPITEHIDRINRLASDFERTKLTDDNLRILLLLQSFCFSRKNENLKKITLRLVEKNSDASLKEITTELEAHQNVVSSIKTLENPTNNVVSSAHVIHAKGYKKKQPANSTSQRSPADNKRSNPSGKTPILLTKHPKCNGCGGPHFRSKCN